MAELKSGNKSTIRSVIDQSRCGVIAETYVFGVSATLGGITEQILCVSERTATTLGEKDVLLRKTKNSRGDIGNHKNLRER